MRGIVADFAERVRRHHGLDIVELPDGRGSDRLRVTRDEGERLLQRIEERERVWLVERSGQEFSSTELAQRLDKLAHDGVSRLTIVVAGPYGASGALLHRADVLWSLSRLTLLHEWARALVLEQLYRAAKITRGEPYHH